MVTTQTNARGTSENGDADTRARIQEILQRRVDLFAESNQLKAEAQRLAVESGKHDLILMSNCW